VRTSKAVVLGAVRLVIVVAVANVVMACSSEVGMPSGIKPTPTVATTSHLAAPLRYVALGDSYTIGTSVSSGERWPDQLVARLPAGTLQLVANLGVNGFTSGDVIAVEQPQLDGLQAEFATLLIGVNDVVQGVPEDRYRANVEAILDHLVRRVGVDRIVVVTTPDYTVTPSGADYGDPATQAAGIRRNNELITAAANARGITVVDIHDLSLRAATDRSLVAVDGLHPSGAQYALWVDRIAPVVAELLAH
jgi:lysophospholipase L1-like esterase